MKKIKRNKISIVFYIVALNLIILISCADSLKNRLTKRLNNFKNALPDEIRIKFDNGNYKEAGQLLDEKLTAIKGYINRLDDNEKKKKFIRGNYSGLEKDIEKMGVPKELLNFNKKFYTIIDYECIPTFSGEQIIDYFKVYFKEKLESIN